MRKIKVFHGVTVAQSLRLMEGLPKYLNSKGLECKVITSDGVEVNRYKTQESCEVKVINMEREISAIKDLLSLSKLIHYFKKEKPRIVNAGTPKAGLLMMLAAWVTRVPIRIYTIRGLRLETTTGFKKKILYLTEKIAIACSTETLAISHSLRDAVINLNLTKPDKIKVVGNGSSNGINLDRFRKTDELKFEIEKLKKEYNIKNEDFVIGSIGRITKDKGIDQLIQVFLELKKNKKNIKLLVIGEFEENDPISDFTKDIILSDPDVIYAGYQSNPDPFYFLMDVFLFLTRREGFGNVSIEAALSAIPVIVKDVVGAKDTVLNNKTGFVVGNSVDAISEKVLELYENSEMKEELGLCGRNWVKENFSQSFVHDELYKFYIEKLKGE